MISRTISHCSHKFANTNCKTCGLYQHYDDPALKTKAYDSFLNSSASKYLKHMRKRQCEALQTKQISEITFSLLESICEKFEYSLETLALGLYVFGKTCKQLEKDEKFYASAALIVASKGIELDKRVPYLNRYQRYADKSFTQSDYEQAERKIFEQMNFDLQNTTFISFLNFYLTNGILFKSDNVPMPSIKHLEDEVMYKAKQFLRNGSFLNFAPEKLALSIIKQTRTKYLLAPWKKQLQIISGYSADQVESIQSRNALKPLSVLSNGILKLREKASNKSETKTATTCENSIQLNEISTKANPKKHNSHLKSLKQNSMKQVQGVNTLRVSAFSSSKYPHNISLSNSTDRMSSVTNFISRRI